jgi:two-component system CheB/CheR fusion protein
MLKQWEELYAGRAYADVEFRLVTKGGQIKWCSSTWGPLYDESGKQIGVQGRERDITERKELEQVVLETTANERRRIGYELHDGLGQLLVGIALKTKTLEENLREGGSAHVGKAKEVVALLNTAIGQTRSLAQGSDPVHVEADGLVAALEKLAATSENLFGVKCVFKCTEKRIRLETQSGPALYRIAQEGIRNAVEHGKARCIEMELETDAIQVCLRIRDNGSGFSPQLRTTGMGLHIMRYRATSIGGSLSISSEPDRGTELRCAAPLKLALPKAGTDFIRKRS